MAPTRHERKLSLEEVEDMEPSPETYAAIMDTNKPNPRGPGYLKLYMLASVIFLCSTMNGTTARRAIAHSHLHAPRI